MSCDKKEYQKKYRESHKEQRITYNKAYYQANKKKKYEYKQRYRQDNREKYIWLLAKNRAKRKGLEFNIEISDIKIPNICPVLKILIKLDATGRPSPGSPSIDRINNNKGYIKGNVRIISYRANQVKSDVTIEELELLLKDLKTNG